jgi:hypothetical protein
MEGGWGGWGGHFCRWGGRGRGAMWIVAKTLTWLVMEASMPSCTICLNSSTLYAMPPPAPPHVKAGRMMSGNFISAAIASASSTVLAVPAEV